jgi:hypothetical protein
VATRIALSSCTGLLFVRSCKGLSLPYKTLHSSGTEERITEEVQVIDDLRHCAMENLSKRLHECIEKQGKHLAGVIFKTKHY